MKSNVATFSLTMDGTYTVILASVARDKIVTLSPLVRVAEFVLGSFKRSV